jgi:hypothetical protein
MNYSKDTYTEDSMLADYNAQELWSEVLPNLWQGGTDAFDEVGRGNNNRRITNLDFDSVYTMCSLSNPVMNGVLEVRKAVRDGNMSDFNPERDLYDLVVMAHRDWLNGKRVLIRCQAGWNRSGILMALVLIREGYTASEAIDLIREKRSRHALSNSHFVVWLLEANVEFWRK